MLLFGLYCAGLCLVKGLNQTNMDNRFAFGLWIFVDLTVIALGAGAIGVQILAGHVEITYYTLMVAGAYAAWRLTDEFLHRRRAHGIRA